MKTAPATQSTKISMGTRRICRRLASAAFAAAMLLVVAVPSASAETAADGAPDGAVVCSGTGTWPGWGASTAAVKGGSGPVAWQGGMYHVHCFAAGFGAGDSGDMWPPTGTYGVIDCYSGGFGDGWCHAFPPDVGSGDGTGDANSDGVYDYSTQPGGSAQDVIDYWGWDCAALVAQFGADNAPPECAGESSVPTHPGSTGGWLTGSGCVQAGVRSVTSFKVPEPWVPQSQWQTVTGTTSEPVWVQCWAGDSFASGLGTDTDKWPDLANGQTLVDCWKGDNARCDVWVGGS